MAEILSFDGSSATARPTLPPEFRSTPTQLVGPLSIWFAMDSVDFPRDTIEGKTSLGGSESAMIGTAQALARRGHDVHIFASRMQLGADDPREYAGVVWHDLTELVSLMPFGEPDVFCALRLTGPYLAMKSSARLNLLWNQDMLAHVAMIAHALPQIDVMVYVSEYQRQQWAGVEVIEPDHRRQRRDWHGMVDRMPSFVTRNGFDPTLVPTWPEKLPEMIQRLEAVTEIQLADMPAEVARRIELQREALRGMRKEGALPVRSPHTFIHISRPERGLDPLIQMWPKIRKAIPDAVLKVCRYSSMYDKAGWGKVCESFDSKLQRLARRVGGIEFLGELNKPQLYQELTRASFMLYPGVDSFAETSCIAAIEAQACGCVFIGSYKGALPETLGPGAGILIEGDAESEAYQTAYVAQVVKMVEALDAKSAVYPAWQEAGRSHVFPAYTFDAIAADWDAFLRSTFQTRYRNNKSAVMRNLLQHDHHAAARLVAEDILAENSREASANQAGLEALAAITRCDDVLAQRAQTAEDYSLRTTDTEVEAAGSARFHKVLDQMDGWMQSLNLPPHVGFRLLDIACGNGAFALAALRRFPNLFVQGWDYSPGVIKQATEALRKAGFSDRCRFSQGGWQEARPGHYDLLFCGEFLEHTERPWEVVNTLTGLVQPGGRCFMTMPHGPWTELMPTHIPIKRGHTHEFSLRDLHTLYGQWTDFSLEYAGMGDSPRGNPCGTWHISWQRPNDNTVATPLTDAAAHLKAVQTQAPMPESQPLDYWRTIQVTRPYQSVVAMMIAGDGAEQWLAKSLESVWNVVDRIVVRDSGLAPHNRAAVVSILSRYPNAELIDGGWIVPENGGFAAARNACLDYVTQTYAPDWVFWLDADEHLVGADQLHRFLYAGGGPYRGFTIRQQHLCLDVPNFFDTPVRVFRPRGIDPAIRFYGIVHEQPEDVMDEGIWPALDYPQTHLVHLGYITGHVRRAKQGSRNLGLLKAELAGPNPRQLAYGLFIRDLVTEATYEINETGQLSPKGQQLLALAIDGWHDKGFDDPHARLHHIIWPFYQSALKMLQMGVEVQWSFAAGQPGFKGKAAVETVYAETDEQAMAYLARKTRQFMELRKGPVFWTGVMTGARPADIITTTPPTPPTT